MGSVLYRNFLRLLEKWPVDSSKRGKELGDYIRGGVAAGFRGGSDEPRDSQTCEEIYSSLSNIASNKYKDAFYVSETSSATGLSQQECQQIISEEFQTVLDKQDRSLKEKIVGAFK